MRVELLAVGTELLLGDVVDTNAAWLGRRLADAGLDVTAETVIGDNAERIRAAVTAAAGRADAVVLTGGLGPTQDDVTREALATAAGVALRRDERALRALRERYASADRAVPERNLRQADLPEGAAALPNSLGSAPGLRMQLSGSVVYALPGVPHEMQAMFDAAVLPDLLRRAGEPAAIVSRVLHTAGLWESEVAEALAGLHERLERAGNPTLAWLAGGGQTRVRITAKAGDRAAALRLVQPVEAEVRAALGESVYGADADTLDVVVHRLLQARGETVAVAESLTGGMLGAALTEMPGASASFLGGVLVYATPLKETLAGVPSPLLDAHGPVSADVAAAMAHGVRERLGATWGLALTGVAGPDPQDGHPPGTLHVGLAGPDGGDVRSLRVSGDRPRIRLHATVAALDLLRRTLQRRG